MNTDKIYAEQLANEYAPKNDSKVIALRKLDARAKLPATIFTYTFGIISALITGIGMCLSMGVIGNSTTMFFALGVVIGIIGLAGMGVNYPVYKKMLAKGKQKYAFEIMELAKEMNLNDYPYVEKTDYLEKVIEPLKDDHIPADSSGELDFMFSSAVFFCRTHFYLCNQERGQCYGIPDFCTVCIFSDNPDCRLTITGRAAKTGESKILEP